MSLILRVVNQVLYFAWDSLNQFMMSIGLSWIQVVSFLVVVSAILRLFIGRLVGWSVRMSHTNPDAPHQQYIEKSKAGQQKRSDQQSAQSSRRGFKGVRPQK